MSLDGSRVNSLQPTCEEYDSDDFNTATNRIRTGGSVRSEAPLPPLPTQQTQSSPPTANPLPYVPSIASDSGYSSRTAATLNSADSAQASLRKVSASHKSIVNPSAEEPRIPHLDVPQKDKTSPPTSYKRAPVSRSRSTSKTEKGSSMRGQYRPGPSPGAYRPLRPAPTPLQTGINPAHTYSVAQPVYSPPILLNSPAVGSTLPRAQWSTSVVAGAPIRRSFAGRPASVNFVNATDGQWVPLPLEPEPPQQTYTLYDMETMSPAYCPDQNSSSHGSRHRHSRRDVSRRRIEEKPSRSHSKRSPVTDGASVTYGSNPIQNGIVARHRSRSRERKKKEKRRERDYYAREYYSSDDEIDERPPSPRRNTLDRTTPRRDSNTGSQPTYERRKKKYYQDSSRSQRDPDRTPLERQSSNRHTRRPHASSTPTVTTQTTIKRTTSRRESSSHQRTRSTDAVVEETQDRMREAEKHMQKSSAGRRTSDARAQVVTSSAQPAPALAQGLLEQKARSVRRPSDSGSQRNAAVRSVAGSSRTAASQLRTDAAGSVKFPHDPSKPMYISASGDVDLCLDQGMAELTISNSRGREQPYRPGGSSRSGASFADRASRR
ncbi:MAG: hypothetical protein M1828_000314 [Chrysothrix sp. TS-e1954]|nr:MAG: hypothetical protein M1828_000314 [Chrysothrix sp. TS-e1954]